MGPWTAAAEEKCRQATTSLARICEPFILPSGCKFWNHGPRLGIGSHSGNIRDALYLPNTAYLTEASMARPSSLRRHRSPILVRHLVRFIEFMSLVSCDGRAGSIANSAPWPLALTSFKALRSTASRTRQNLSEGAVRCLASVLAEPPVFKQRSIPVRHHYDHDSQTCSRRSCPRKRCTTTQQSLMRFPACVVRPSRSNLPEARRLKRCGRASKRSTRLRFPITLSHPYIYQVLQLFHLLSANTRL